MFSSAKRILVACVLSCAAPYALSLSGAQIDGVVLDKVTGLPIPGAVVLATWRGQRSDLAHGSTVCYHVETARTDAVGKYRILAWSEPFDWRRAMIGSRILSVEAFKPGYMRPTKGISKGEKVFVVPRDRITYFEDLNSFFISSICPESGSSGNNLYPFLDALVKEAQLVARTPEQHKLVQNMVNVRDDYAGPTAKP